MLPGPHSSPASEGSEWPRRSEQPWRSGIGAFGNGLGSFGRKRPKHHLFGNIFRWDCSRTLLTHGQVVLSQNSFCTIVNIAKPYKNRPTNRRVASVASRTLEKLRKTAEKLRKIPKKLLRKVPKTTKILEPTTTWSPRVPHGDLPRLTNLSARGPSHPDAPGRGRGRSGRELGEALPVFSRRV